MRGLGTRRRGVNVVEMWQKRRNNDNVLYWGVSTAEMCSTGVVMWRSAKRPEI